MSFAALSAAVITHALVARRRGRSHLGPYRSCSKKKGTTACHNYHRSEFPDQLSPHYPPPVRLYPFPFLPRGRVAARSAADREKSRVINRLHDRPDKYINVRTSRRTRCAFRTRRTSRPFDSRDTFTLIRHSAEIRRVLEILDSFAASRGKARVRGQ